MILRILGERVAVKLVDEENDSVIIKPENTSKNLERLIGMVVAVGDGKVKFNHEPRQMEMVVCMGDLVLFQMNSIQAANAMYETSTKEKIFVLNQGDCIARLKSASVGIDDITMLGPWCLVEPFRTASSSKIVLPDTADPIYDDVPRFRLIMKGTHADVTADIGQELICEKQLVNRLEIGNKKFGFVSVDRIYGVVD
jgi:co-chaperonin GroES (HSP10)